MSFPNSSNNTNKMGEIDVQFENILRNCMLFSYFFTILAAIIMNSVVLLAVYMEKALHNANKYFVACLALSDFMVAAFSVTIRLYQLMKPGVSFSIHVCRFWIWVDIFTELASITTLTIISVDRYFKVGKPFKYKTMMSTTRCKIIITFLWLYSAIVAFLGLVPYGESKGVHITPDRGFCINDNKVFYTMAAFIGFFVPVIIIIIMCVLMFRIVKNFQRSRSTRNQDPRFNSPIMPRVHVTGKSVTNSKRRTVAIFTLVVFVFIVCWGPFFVLFLIAQYKHSLLTSNMKRFQILSTIFFSILPYANSFLNPIIYAYFDKAFNMAIKNLLLKMLRKQPRTFQSMATSRVLVRLASRNEEVFEEHTLVESQK